MAVLMHKIRAAIGKYSCKSIVACNAADRSYSKKLKTCRLLSVNTFT